MVIIRAQSSGTAIVRLSTKIRKKRTPKISILIEADESVDDMCLNLEESVIESLEQPIIVPEINCVVPEVACVVPEVVCLHTFPTNFKKLLKKKYTLKDGHAVEDWKLVKCIKKGNRLEKFICKRAISFIQNNKANCQICSSKSH